MMLEKYKEEIRENPTKYIIVLIVLLILGFVCIYQFREYFIFVWPDEKSYNNTKKQLLKSQKDLQETLNEQHRLMERRKSFATNKDNFWVVDRDGDYSLNIQKKINKAAASSEVQLSSMGATRTEKVTDGIQLVSISIRSTSTLKKLSAFLNELDKIKPRAYWKSLVLRPDNPRKPVNIVLSGNLQFVLIEDEEALKILQEEK